MSLDSPRYKRKVAKCGAISSPPRRRPHTLKAGVFPSSGLFIPRARNGRHRTRSIVNPISSSYWNDLLHLLWLVLWADGRPCEAKTEAFRNSVFELKYVIDPQAKFTTKDVQHWRHIHESPRLSFTRKLSGDVVCEKLFYDMKTGGHALDVITSMVQIALADGVYSVAERALIKKTILLWDMPEKAATDIDYVCENLMDAKS